MTNSLKSLLTTIADSPSLHAKWLNTLSYLENCGARKIAACQHPRLVKEEMLKHAAEEFRHAHYLKRQIKNITPDTLETYTLPHLLGGTATLHYLTSLDIQTSRYLKNLNYSKNAIKEAAYLLVTYAIELRAEELYPLYDEVLRKTKVRVAVKSILMEEKEHLNEMREGLKELPEGFTHAEQVCRFESILCENWLEAIKRDVECAYTTKIS